MDLSKLRSTTPRGRPAPIRPARPVNGPRPDRTVNPGPASVQAQATPPTPTPTPVLAPSPIQNGDAGRALNAAPYVARQVEDKDKAWVLVEEIIRSAIRDAYSERLPNDPPTVHRNLETRRRAYVQVAALHAVNYSPAFKHDDDAGIQALGKVRALLVEHKRDADVRAGRTPAPAPAPAPAPMVAPNGGQTPLIAPDPADKLIAAVLRAMDKLIEGQRQFVDAHVVKNPRLKEAALRYLDSYDKTGDARTDRFMLDVRSKLDVRSNLRLASLTDRQARAVLNIWLSHYAATRAPHASGK
jgi:hypothetical protein